MLYYLFIWLFSYLFTSSFTYLFICFFIYFLLYFFIYFFIYFFLYLFIYLFICILHQASIWLTAIGTVTDDKGRTYSKESGEVIMYMTEKMKLNDAAVKTAETSSTKMEIENIDSSSMKSVIDNGSASNDHMNVVNDHIDNGNGFIDTSRVNNTLHATTINIINFHFN